MRLSARVMCNCFRDGKTSPLPIPTAWIEVDADGSLSLNKEHESGENWTKLYEWMESCCEHENMEFVHELIANWGGYRLFQAALEQAGFHHFPVLRAELPDRDEGVTPSTSCARLLKELDAFHAIGNIGKKTVLVDSETGDELVSRIADYDGVFIELVDSGIRVGLSECELFAVDSRTGQEIFRATRFRQFNKDGSKITGKCDPIVWENLDTGQIFESGISILGPMFWKDGSWWVDIPPRLQVERRAWNAEEFTDIIESLRCVFTASINTGNPVCWC